jgi:S1-C subfamily serine protease
MQFRLLTLGIGTETEVAYLRDFEPRVAKVALAPAPEDPPRELLTVTARSVLNGLSVANANPALIAELGLPFETTGVVVTGVEGVATRSRLRVGDVLVRINGAQIGRSGDVDAIAAARVARFEIEFERGGQRGVIRLSNR